MIVCARQPDHDAHAGLKSEVRNPDLFLKQIWFVGESQLAQMKSWIDAMLTGLLGNRRKLATTSKKKKHEPHTPLHVFSVSVVLLVIRLVFGQSED